MQNYKRPYLTTVLLTCLPVLAMAALVSYLGVRVILRGDLSGLFLVALALWVCYDRIEIEYSYRRIQYIAELYVNKVEELEIGLETDPSDYWKNDSSPKDLF